MTKYATPLVDTAALHDIGITQVSKDDETSTVYIDDLDNKRSVPRNISDPEPVGSDLARAVALQQQMGSSLSCGGFIKNMFQCFSPIFVKKPGMEPDFTLPSQDSEKWLLPPQVPEDRGKKTLVLDLDESLVHSSFQPTSEPDFVLPFQVGEHVYTMYVGKRPGVDEFLKRMSSVYEIVVFTASLAKYANPLLDLLDTSRVVRSRLFRDSCVTLRGCYVKDLSRLGRPLKSCMLLDNSPASYALQPGNAIPVTSWFGSQTDTELFDLIPYLEDAAQVDDVCSFLAKRKPKFA